MKIRFSYAATKHDIITINANSIKEIKKQFSYIIYLDSQNGSNKLAIDWHIKERGRLVDIYNIAMDSIGLYQAQDIMNMDDNDFEKLLIK